MAQAFERHPSLMETMEEVPHLLASCVASIGVKSLRLVCQSARTIAPQTVRSYILKLAHQPSTTEPLLAVASFLKSTMLRQLHVEVSIPKYGTNCGPTKMYTLSSQIQQLQQFSSAISAALATVTSLDLTINYQGYKVGLEDNTSGGLEQNSWMIDRNINRPCTASDMTDTAGSNMSALLASACPNICHLGLGGGVGQKVVKQLGVLLPKLASVEVLDGNLSLAREESVDTAVVQQGHIVPSLTHLKMIHRMLDWHHGQVERVKQLLQCPTITHLELSSEWLSKGKHLLLLPPRLQVLFSSLPLYGNFDTFRMSSELHLGCFESVVLPITNGYKEVILTTLLSLLAAAPCLTSLSVHNTRLGNCLAVEACPQYVIGAAQKLQIRMTAGFSMNGIQVHCRGTAVLQQRAGNDDPAPAGFSLEQAIRRLPLVPMFNTCMLTGAGTPGCLLATSHMCPHLESLILQGIWTETDMHKNVLFDCLKVLDVWSYVIYVDAVLCLVQCAPALNKLVLRPFVAKQDFLGEITEFQARLRATQVPAPESVESCGDRLLLGDWTLLEKTPTVTKWCRKETAV